MSTPKAPVGESLPSSGVNGFVRLLTNYFRAECDRRISLRRLKTKLFSHAIESDPRNAAHSAGLELLAICHKIREVRGASAWHVRLSNPFRAVAQLGRAPGSGQLPGDFLKLSQLALTCSTLGKPPNSRDLNSRPNTLKFFRQWIKRWIKTSGHPV